MSERIAFYIKKEELEEFFDTRIQRESLFEPHYNLAPAQHIPVLFSGGEDQEEESPLQMKRIRWGLDREEFQSNEHSLEIEEALEGVKKGNYHPCVIPISGYYKWKRSGKRADQPFFVRMLDESLMALAGVAVKEPSGGKGEDDLTACAIILTESNALIQPLVEKMPLQLTKELSQAWIQGLTSPEELLEEAKGKFHMTDFTVHRVSSKVNDLSENSPELIQPLPK
ncbi:MAG: SOS response-associated peptidase family protein [Balneolaceae bacterium]